jgi:hypothetical protein
VQAAVSCDRESCNGMTDWSFVDVVLQEVLLLHCVLSLNILDIISIWRGGDSVSVDTRVTRHHQHWRFTADLHQLNTSLANDKPVMRHSSRHIARPALIPDCRCAAAACDVSIHLSLSDSPQVIIPLHHR